MKWFKMDGIGKRIGLFVSLIIIVALLGISSFNYIISKNEITRSNTIILKNAIETIMADINRNYSYTKSDTNGMSEESAKEASIHSIESLQNGQADALSAATAEGADATSAATKNSFMARHTLDLGESGYFYIINSQGEIIAHPFLEDNIKDLKADDGRNIIQDVITLSKSGGGMIHYTLNDEVSIIRDGKTVYTKYFPYWDWVVCAVIYDKDFSRGSDMILISNLIGVGIVLLISLILVNWLSGRITKPIKSVAGALYEVSNGDLTQSKIDLNTKDETKLLADSVNRLLDSFKHIVKMMTVSSSSLNQFAMNLSQSSEVVSETTVAVSQAISQMAEQTEIQCQETQDTVHKITLLGDDIRHTAEEGTRIELAAQRNLELKEEGQTSVNNLKDANRENQANSIEIEKIIHKINESSKDIGDITAIITNVANQTNLLALNASIEAARAGEHGAGFAIVGEEIRKLANETAIATENIRNKIIQMQEESEEAVRFININRSGVEKINVTVEQTGNVINRIEEGLLTQIEGIREIAERNKEINSKKDDILKLLQHVAKTAEENSSSTEEISATAEEQSTTMVEVTSSITQLYDMVQELNGMINQFKI
ncbi:methyl-accepting chemotaxis protein [Anaerocolumna sp. MB42-C2]|uniref:methyl-accepting chemotaxis protein n=1 Tax=Anaerocolumna sp. MB42-C2 TaxID=3070997 RepID=UPI0027DF0733|nr:methyl-accepting chemotaxis protein [Anaerocolumna sp. MB42-C2]WMJ87037.1 methyl-accepting chemotaxis protein [Anaerocolumna sp. MB42-C2]